RSVRNAFWPSNEGNFSMTERMQILNCGLPSQLVVDNDRTDGSGVQFMANHCRRDVAILQITEYFDIYKQPVGNYDQGFHPPNKQHFQIALKPAALVVYVGQNWQK